MAQKSDTRKPRYLTKSRYKLAIECPAKLYYTGKPEYANQKEEDSFLEALAQGGFQVGALAKLYFPGGVEISSKDYETSVKETNKLLEQNNVIIYEAAVQTDDFFVRVDILVKRGGLVDLIEVKSKSIDQTEEEETILTKKGLIRTGWQPYLKDVAFQKYVLSKAFPKFTVSAFLMLADKTALCPTNELNQKFRIKKDKNGRASVIVSPSITPADLADQILTRVSADSYCDLIYAGKENDKKKLMNYEAELKYFAENYKNDTMIPPEISSICGKCEFYAAPEDKAAGLRCGFEECWKKAKGWKPKDFEEPSVLDIWATKNKNSFIAAGKVKMKDIVEGDIKPKLDGRPGLSQSQRIWLQIDKVKKNDASIYVDRPNLKAAMDKFIFPLHFIDFETSMVAIPFNKGRHPYEGIAFQFSHHVVEKDGAVRHAGEYLNVEPGAFPNYAFVRALKKELEGDNGTIFRYAAHENTYLIMIKNQLIEEKSKIPDKAALISFIDSITTEKSEGKKIPPRVGARTMVDLKELIVRFYYDPVTNGSNSIKDVLPAVLHSSRFLQDKYSKPIYGAKGGIPSINFTDMKWLEIKGGKVINPYERLPKMFKDINEYEIELLSDSDELKEGGAAAIAYARLQFEEMSDYERKELVSALLRYCELDTLAMVMLYECWRELLREK